MYNALGEAAASVVIGHTNVNLKVSGSNTTTMDAEDSPNHGKSMDSRSIVEI